MNPFEKFAIIQGNIHVEKVCANLTYVGRFPAYPSTVREKPTPEAYLQA